MESYIIMLCGPHLHDDRDSPQYHRIDAAAALWVASSDPDRTLLVSGDARKGQDIDRFIERACELGATRTERCYDPGASTLTDLQAALRYIRDRDIEVPGIRLLNLTLVTDVWHMDRARGMLFGELTRFDPGQIALTRFTAHNVHGGRPPTAEQLRREQAGLQAYLNGTYQRHSGLAWGKPPALPTFVTPSSDRA